MVHHIFNIADGKSIRISNIGNVDLSSPSQSRHSNSVFLVPYFSDNLHSISQLIDNDHNDAFFKSWLCDLSHTGSSNWEVKKELRSLFFSRQNHHYLIHQNPNHFPPQGWTKIRIYEMFFDQVIW